MRVRKLGRGQSIVFCAPIDVENKILEIAAKRLTRSIEVSDVLYWSIKQSCDSMRNLAPLWAVQGVRCQRRNLTWSKYIDKDSQTSLPEIFESLLEVEAQTLDQRYSNARQDFAEDVILRENNTTLTDCIKEQVDQIRKVCSNFEVKTFQAASLSEEQERELSPEIQQEREVQGPPPATALIPSLHEDVKYFATTGIREPSSQQFLPAFDVFKSTSGASNLDAKRWPSDILVTEDFQKTVAVKELQKLDLFLRPVHWVLRSMGPNRDQLVIISPHEANELIPTIRENGKTTLHVYAARGKLTMEPLDDLRFCTVPGPRDVPLPSSVLRQLNIFAGQLY